MAAEPAGSCLRAVRSRTLHERAGSRAGVEPDVVFEIRAGAKLAPILPEALAGSLVTAALAEVRGGAEARHGEPVLPALPHPRFCEDRHIDALETTLPWSVSEGGRSLLVLAPWLRLGGPQRALSELVRAACALDTGLEAHLMLTAKGLVEGTPETALAPFSTVTSLAGADPAEVQHLLERLVQGADIVLHADALEGYAVLPYLGDLHRAVHVALVTTSVAPGRSSLDALSVLHHEPVVDAYLAPSRRVGRRLANLQAVPDKIALAPPAPALRPASTQHAHALVRDKAARLGDPRSPLRVLWAGDAARVDAVARGLEQGSVPHELAEAVGEPDPAAAAAQLADADVLLLSSPGAGAGVPAARRDGLRVPGRRRRWGRDRGDPGERCDRRARARPTGRGGGHRPRPRRRRRGRRGQSGR